MNISSPTDGAVFQESDLISLNITATDANGSISNVSIYDGANLLTTITKAPYQYDINGLTFGTHVLQIKVTDDLGGITIKSITIYVLAPSCSSLLWSSSSNYVAGDIVAYNDMQYAALQNNVAKVPASSTAEWKVLGDCPNVTSSEEAYMYSLIKVYPNPTEGKFKVSLGAINVSDFAYNIVDLNGKVIVSKLIGKVGQSYEEMIDLTEYRLNGNYLMYLQINGNTYTEKLNVINKPKKRK